MSYWENVKLKIREPVRGYILEWQLNELEKVCKNWDPVKGKLPYQNFLQENNYENKNCGF